MAQLTHGLDTVELGSVNWRLILNSNIEKLDANRIYSINQVDLPSNSGLAGRFFYTIDTNNLYYDNGTSVVLLSVRSFEDLVGVEDMTGKSGNFAIVNGTEDGLEFVNIIDLGTF